MATNRIRTQADQRRAISPLDQYGRKWGLHIELITGDPTGGIYPAGWSDPLRTPMHLLRVPKDETGQAILGKIEVDFPKWLEEIEAAEQNWYQELHRNALHVYKAVDPSDVAKLDQDKFLLDLTGPKPWPSSEVLRLAQAGDRAFLGLIPLTQRERAMLRMPSLEDLKHGPVVHKEPAPVDATTPPDKYPAFVSWAMKNGAVQPGDLKAAAELWKAHREELAASAG